LREQQDEEVYDDEEADEQLDEEEENSRLEFCEQKDVDEQEVADVPRDAVDSVEVLEPSDAAAVDCCALENRSSSGPLRHLRRFSRMSDVEYFVV